MEQEYLLIKVYSNTKFSSRGELSSLLATREYIACDIETVSISDHRVLAVSIAWSPQDVACFSGDEVQEIARILSRNKSIFHNVLFDVPILEECYGINVNYCADSILLAQALGYPPALGDLASPLILDFSHQPISDLLYNDLGKKVKGRTLADCSFNDISRICSWHAMGAYKVWEELKDKAPSSYTLDYQLLPILMKLHDRGIRVDQELARTRYDSMLQEVKYYKDLCEGMGFNPASSMQIGLYLSQQGLMTRFNPNGRMVTDEEALSSIYNDHACVPLVLEFRKRSKLASTYVKPLTSVERLYPRYHIVRTGRFASKPNIQNIPPSQRDLYIADEGEYLLDADLKQIEPVVMAYLSQDPELLAATSSGDVYQPIADKTRVQRYTAKQLLLAGAYGSGVDTLIETARGHGDILDVQSAYSMLQTFKRTYSGLISWGEEQRGEARRKGYVTTMLGRIRTLENMLENEPSGYDPLQKVVNTIVQGSAAELLKLAILALQDEKMVANVHDEILFTTNHDISMPSEIAGVKVRWDVGKGYRWSEAKK